MTQHSKFCITVDDVTASGGGKESRNCGTGKGGFQPGNTCARGSDGIPDVHDLTHDSNLGGSTGAALMRDPKGRKFVVKSGNSPEHVESEYLADRLYEAMGAAVPASRMSSRDGEPAKVAEYVAGKPLAHLSGEAKQAAYAKLREHFVADALLANWDVIGMGQDNIIVDSKGTPYRIDNGGSLKFRAQGAPKTYGPEVGEIDTLRSSNQGKPVFGSVTDADISKQVADIVKRRDSILHAAASNPEVQSTLSKRIDYLARKYGRADEARALAALERARLALRNCGTGAGGFQPGNTCAKGGDGEATIEADQDVFHNKKYSKPGEPGVQAPHSDSSFVKWRDRNKEMLDQVRARVLEVGELANDLIAQARKKDDELRLKEAELLEKFDDLKFDERAMRKSLAALATEKASEEEKKHYEEIEKARGKEGLALYIQHTVNSNPEVEKKRLELMNVKDDRIAANQKWAKAHAEVESQSDYLVGLIADSKKIAFEEIGKLSISVATSQDGNAYSKEAIEGAAKKFRSDISNLPIVGADGLFEQGAAKSLKVATGFYEAVLNPASISSRGVRNATIVSEQIGARAHAEDRTSFEGASYAVHVPPQASASCIVHELGHCIEFSDEIARSAAVDFQAYRCGGHESAPMSKFNPNGSYSDAEIGNQDKFLETLRSVHEVPGRAGRNYLGPEGLSASAAYVGKVYLTKESKRVTNTEIVSMGFEMLYNNPTALAKSDPEYFDLIVGIATGAIHK